MADQAVNKKKILIVDDEADIRELYSDILSEGNKYKILLAKDGDEALEISEQEKPDLVLLDIIMPGKDGYSTLTEIKKDAAKYGTPKVYLLTNIGGEIAVEEAMKLGAEGFKIKLEVEPKDLIQLVEEQIG